MRKTCITAAISGILALSESIASANLLTDPGFDTNPLGPPIPTQITNFPLYQNQWGPEAGAIVPAGSVIPTSAPFMYAFQPTGAYTEVAQLFDVTTFAPAIDANNAQLVAGTMLNTGAAAAIGVISINYFSAANYASLFGPTPGATLFLDANQATWEPIALGPVTVPAGTRWIQFTIGFDSASLLNSTGIVGGAYTDDAYVDIHVVPEPGSIGVLATAGGALMLRRRRRTVVVG